MKPPDPVVRLNAAFISGANHAARERGILSIWTIFNRPKDYPEGHIARRFEAGGATVHAVPTSDTVTGELAAIREAMMLCALFCMQRDEGDHPNIVESWL